MSTDIIGMGNLSLDLTPAQFQSIQKNGFAFTQQLNLLPGHYRLRLGVSDTNSDRLGTLDMTISVPAQAAGKKIRPVHGSINL